MANPDPASGENLGGGNPIDDIISMFSTIMDTPHAIAAAATSMEKFWKTLTDKYMWRSLGWIIIGLIILVAGILSWMKKAGFEPPVPPIPVPIP